MAKNTYQECADLVTISATAAVTSGSGVLVGELFGIAVHDAAIGADLTICTEGAFTVSKVSAQAWTVGQVVCWDAAAGNFTTTATGNKKVGVAIVAAANPSATGVIRLGFTVA